MHRENLEEGPMGKAVKLPWWELEVFGFLPSRIRKFEVLARKICLYAYFAPYTYLRARFAEKQRKGPLRQI